jgi:hypothetical protein
MSQFLPLLRGRLSQIARTAATAAKALHDTDTLDLPGAHLAGLLREMDGVAAGVGGITDRLANAIEPARIAGLSGHAS